MAAFIGVMLLGNVGADASSKEFNGQYVVEFSLAVTENYKDKNGEWQKKTTWFRISYWTKNGEYHTYIKKGDLVLVTSNRIEARAYNGKDGLQASLEVTASKVTLCTPKDKQNAPAPVASTQTANANAPVPPPVNDASYFENNPEDLPW